MAPATNQIALYGKRLAHSSHRVTLSNECTYLIVPISRDPKSEDEDIGGSSGQAKRCVTKLVHNLAVSSPTAPL